MYLSFFVSSFFARSALGAQTTDTDNNSGSSAESVLQPAGYNATRCPLFQLVAFIGPWDPPSRIELGPVSYSNTAVSAVCDRRNRHSSAVLLLCFALLLLPLSQAAERATLQPRGQQYVPTWCCRRLPMICATHTAAVFTAVFVVELNNTWYAVLSYEYVYRSRITR